MSPKENRRQWLCKVSIGGVGGGGGGRYKVRYRLGENGEYEQGT